MSILYMAACGWVHEGKRLIPIEKLDAPVQ